MSRPNAEFDLLMSCTSGARQRVILSEFKLLRVSPGRSHDGSRVLLEGIRGLHITMGMADENGEWHDDVA